MFARETAEQIERSLLERSDAPQPPKMQNLSISSATTGHPFVANDSGGMSDPGSSAALGSSSSSRDLSSVRKLAANQGYRDKESEDSDEEKEEIKRKGKGKEDNNSDEEREEKKTGKGKGKGKEDDDDDVNQLVRDFGFSLEGGFEKAKLEYLYHVTKSTDTYNSILNEGFKPYRADDVNYDGALAEAGAPNGIFFCATLYKGELPTLSLYPRPPPNNKMAYKNQKFPRISIRVDTLSLDSDYLLYLVKKPSKPKTKVKNDTRHLHIAFIHQKNAPAVEWAKKSNLRVLKLDNPLFRFDGEWFCLRKGQGDFDLWTNVFIVPAPGDTLRTQLQTAYHDNVKHL